MKSKLFILVYEPWFIFAFRAYQTLSFFLLPYLSTYPYVLYMCLYVRVYKKTDTAMGIPIKMTDGRTPAMLYILTLTVTLYDRKICLCLYQACVSGAINKQTHLIARTRAFK